MGTTLNLFTWGKLTWRSREDFPSASDARQIRATFSRQSSISAGNVHCGCSVFNALNTA
ncbi:hypothetical protein PPTG_24263 [Phytophthora nicotianae INRA-310]|uniref:Uncharacterized protein n=1 Tax=Phytophthora nicotianae (strain INRA-310) TaxID=761204 RepID=W2PIE5_PHYN3|nr:hypothetical protein PPTG_24263 [Phytophthora nicotianae INRA-310]ETN00411.1 hypothetical protein PPTG_24263 [Phytophthora nicotianae INRA-310]